ncbi:hypothetical protein KR032_010957, partial [Drosophila birchii]
AKCKELGLESQLKAYQIRLHRSYVGVFVILHLCVTIVHCVLISTLSQHKKYVYFDMSLYIGSCVILLLILSINFWKKLIKRHTWIMFVSSALACLTLVCADVTQTLYHHYLHDWQCGSFYETYIVYMIYLFLPILSIKGAMLLGSIVTTVYIVIYVYIMSASIDEMQTSFGEKFLELIHCLGINVLGIYCRHVNEMVVRSSFIDRHQFVKEEFLLRTAQRQEKHLLDSILPSQFSELLQKDIKNRIVLSTRFGSGPNRNLPAYRRPLAIQVHSDVSILYADVVNYTHLTTTLTVEKLVTTLHDLYARFDLAAKHYNVQRIKFLGDCYYCVAGLSHPDPDHANNAVALGIAMIDHMQEVRDAQNLDINMRIGVHSGSLFAGVIGEAKLQYDVWGPDVTIANVLESTGVPGAVHISAATMNSLTTFRYIIESGPETAQKNPFLRKHRITTYIIVSIYQDLSEVGSAIHDETDPTKLPPNLSTLFKEELQQEFQKMPVIRINFESLYSIVHREALKDPLIKKMDICLTFYDNELEKAYLKQSDYLFKYHILLAWFTACCLECVQIMDISNLCLACCVVKTIMFMLLTALTFLSWYKQICWMRYGKKNKPHKYNRISCTIFRIHEKLQKSLTVRICTYLYVIMSNWISILFITMNCRYEEFILRYIEERIFRYESRYKLCFQPWVSTDLIGLMIGMAFFFSHVPFMLKTLVAVGHVLVYFILVFLQFDFIFHHSKTTNPYFPSEFAHGILIIIVFVIMYLKARQTEFSKKVNFNWRVELEKKHNDATITNRSIIILLNNILPNHVVDIYLSSLSYDGIYYENYKMVSVMFAMLTNFQINMQNLRILNEVITQFDELLLHYKEYYVVEKIKIVNCTYMAACGLDVNFAGAISKPLNPELLNEGVYISLLAGKRVSCENNEEVVFVMASFALDLMRTLASCNKAYNGIIKEYDIINAMIMIGISSGEVMAGIVGASKPHYDIWGDPVNMAARMEMTGQSDHIQVTEESANILQTFGIQCNYRGMTFVKGRGLLPTYFLGIDEDYNFIRIKEKRIPSYSHRSDAVLMEETYASPETD